MGGLPYQIPKNKRLVGLWEFSGRDFGFGLTGHQRLRSPSGSRYQGSCFAMSGMWIRLSRHRLLGVWCRISEHQAPVLQSVSGFRV